MRKLVSEPTPAFVQAINNGLNHWLSETIDLDAESIREIDPQKDNLFQILEYGLQLPNLWEPIAELMIQAFPLPDRNGYWKLWVSKLKIVISNGPKSPTPNLVRLQINYGKLLRVLWQLEEAINAHLIAMHNAKITKDEYLLANVMMEMGWDYLWQNDLDNAKISGQKALQIYKSLQNHKTIQMVDTMRLLGLVETRQGNVAKAIKLLREALGGAKKIDMPVVVARTCMGLGLAYREQQNIPEAMECFGMASDVLLNTTYENDKVDVFVNFGLLYFDQGMWEAAGYAFNRANNQYLRESGDLKQQAILWNNLGNVYLKQLKFGDAENYLLEALELWPEINDEIQWANTLLTLAEVYLLQARKNEAENLIEDAFEKVKKYPNHAWAVEIKEELKELQNREA